MNTRLDLREAKLLRGLQERLFVEPGDGALIIHSIGLPRGTYEVALMLAVGGFERFVTELFEEAAQRVLKLEDERKAKYTKAFRAQKRFQNPSPKNIEDAFAIIGLFDIWAEDVQPPESKRSKLQELVDIRHRVAHGREIARFDENPEFGWSDRLMVPEHSNTRDGLEKLLAQIEEIAIFLAKKVDQALEELP